MFTKKCSETNTVIKLYQLFSKHDRSLKNTLIINLKHYPKITLDKNRIFFRNNETLQEIEYENTSDAQSEFNNIHDSLCFYYKKL